MSQSDKICFNSHPRGQHLTIMIHTVSFDFSTKTEKSVAIEEIPEEAKQGNHCWVEADPSDAPDIQNLLRKQNINDIAIEQITGADNRDGRYDVYPRCLHFSLTEARMENSRIVSAHVDVALTESCFITINHSDAILLRNMRSTYSEDFQMFAKSPGFLLYEVGDHLLEQYRRTLRSFSSEIEQIQTGLFGKVDDGIFKHVSELTTDLLQFRRIVLAARDVLHELGTRKSPFVSESTQPFLLRTAERLERLGEDISVERDTLNETLHLYMGMVSHRTNKVVNRLTAISTIFLPLAFLCGVYGMNFDYMPELGWEYSYPAFWSVVLFIAASIILIMKKQKWI